MTLISPSSNPSNTSFSLCQKQRVAVGLGSDFIDVEALRFLFDVLDYDTFTRDTGHSDEIIRVVD